MPVESSAFTCPFCISHTGKKEIMRILHQEKHTWIIITKDRNEKVALKRFIDLMNIERRISKQWEARRRANNA